MLRGPFVMMQFSYRLESYVNLMVSGGVLAGLVLLRGVALPRARTALSGALAGGAVLGASSTPTTVPRAVLGRGGAAVVGSPL